MKNFWILTLFMLLAFSCASPPETESKQETESISQTSEQQAVDQKELRHVVIFKFKETSSAEDIAKVEEAFAELPSKIPEIRDFEWGTNNSPEGLNKGFTHAFLVTFGSEADREVYLPHPAHQAFVDVLRPHLDDVMVVDYWAGE